MLALIKRSKIAYATYNFFNKKRLQHNIPIYKKYKLNKSYYSPISSADFKALGVVERKIDWEKIKQNSYFQNLSEENKASILSFDEKGYAVIRNFLSPEQVAEVNTTIDNLMNDGTIKVKYRNKFMFAIHHSEMLRNIGENPAMLDLLSTLFDGEAKLFQSINFITGSQQKTHSDSIHMTTFPLGGLLGVWIALEDVDRENGALHYYPGSHKLPYYLNSDYDNEGTRFFVGKKGYQAYEEMLEQKVAELGLEKEIFSAKSGDMLIWHANILHGGEPHLDKERTRKSMVFHYFDAGSICYHEVTQRPALF